jgi:8-oxo-dGTP pyrophosphatase MutT (NUDIX family)
MHRFAAVAVIDPRGRLLMQERGADALHEPGRWGYPGGDLETGEDFVDAAVRELVEETGLVVDAGDLESLGVRRFRSDGCGGHDEFELFAVRTTATQADVVCGEGVRITFVDLDDVPDRPLHRATELTMDRVREWVGAHPFDPGPDPRRFAGIILVDRRGWILLQERDEHPRIDPEKWGLAGGHVDPGEDFEPAAHRELEEETGVRLPAGALWLFREFVVDHREAYGTWDVMQVFVASTDLTDADIDCREGRQIVFVDPAVARGLDLSSAATDIVPAFLDSDVYASMAP